MEKKERAATEKTNYKTWIVLELSLILPYLKYVLINYVKAWGKDAILHLKVLGSKTHLVYLHLSETFDLYLKQS